MTEPSRIIIGYLTGKGWTKLSDLRAGLKWPQSRRLANDLGMCINWLECDGDIRTTQRGEPGFSVCLTSEVML